VTPAAAPEVTLGRLSGQVALITGAARGQGEAIARLFSAEGCSVLITDVLDEPGHALAGELGPMVAYRHQDVSAEAEWAPTVSQALEFTGRLDVLVNNAGMFVPTPLLETSATDYLRTIEVNQVGTFLGMQAAARIMVEQQSGSIINTSSVAGYWVFPGSSAYNASKWAVRGMTRTAAIELGPHGVRVNAIVPGYIDSPMLAKPGRDLTPFDRAVPLGRIGRVGEIARAALFLACEDSGYVTGSDLIVDGGLIAGGYPAGSR
jgi:3alpha(or 20beta)-hydroxysteroid dehydrogenase